MPTAHANGVISIGKKPMVFFPALWIRRRSTLDAPTVRPETARTVQPSGYVNIAIENGHENSELSHEKWWFSHSYVNVYQRVIL